MSSHVKPPAKPLVALYKAFRGGEWFGQSLASIADYTDGAVVVLSRKSWIGGDAENNCADVAAKWAERRPGWLRIVWLDTARQEEQYEFGLAMIRKEFGAESAVLVIDTDEVWEPDSLIQLRRHIQGNPGVHYFCAPIVTYIRSPLYQVYPQEIGCPVVGLQNARPQPIRVRFQDRSFGPFLDCHDIRFHHFPYVREEEASLLRKFAATSSQENTPSNPSWWDEVWPQLPLGRNLHMSRGFERCWREIKVLSWPRITLPGFCERIILDEDDRWKHMLEQQPPNATLVPVPTPEDAEKYPEFGELCGDVTLLRSRLKMTYLESLVLAREAGRVSPDGNILEIGSGDGGSLAVMALSSFAELWAVDPFTPYDELAQTLVRGVTEGNEQRFWETADCYGYRSRLRHLRANSDVAAVECPDESFDLILVDGNHSYPIALKDLQLYWPKVKPGGMILAHDYTTRFPGVIQACREWGVPYSVFAGTSLAYARKPA